MYMKISSMLDKVANNLESKGLLKEAFELDRIADSLGKLGAIAGKPKEIAEEISKDIAAVAAKVDNLNEQIVNISSNRSEFVRDFTPEGKMDMYKSMLYMSMQREFPRIESEAAVLHEKLKTLKSSLKIVKKE